MGRIGEQAGTNWTYYHGDALGSVRQLTNSSGFLMYYQTFEPYGEVRESSGTGQSSYGFAGEWTDESGLVYLRARYLNTGMGRFTSRDTWGGDYTRPQSLNRWAYTEGNPVNFTDPSGNCMKMLGSTDCEFEPDPVTYVPVYVALPPPYQPAPEPVIEYVTPDLGGLRGAPEPVLEHVEPELGGLLGAPDLASDDPDFVLNPPPCQSYYCSGSEAIEHKCFQRHMGYSYDYWSETSCENKEFWTEQQINIRGHFDQKAWIPVIGLGVDLTGLLIDGLSIIALPAVAPSIELQSAGAVLDTGWLAYRMDVGYPEDVALAHAMQTSDQMSVVPYGGAVSSLWGVGLNIQEIGSYWIPETIWMETFDGSRPEDGYP